VSYLAQTGRPAPVILLSSKGEATTSSQSAFFIRVYAAKPHGGTRLDPKRFGKY
jgi:hypothetical protein